MAFSIYSNLGYVQGMSYLASCLFICIEDEFKVFVILSNILASENLVSEFYDFNLDSINNYHDIFNHVLKEKMPDFHKKLEDSNITEEIFLFEWIITMYSS